VDVTSSGWEIAASIATSAAAVFAGVQILFSRRDANSRAVFQHLTDIDIRLQRAWAADVESAREDVLAYYRLENAELTEGARSYLSLLNGLDLLALAVDKKLVDRQTVDEYIKTLISPQVLSLGFLQELQRCCGDANVYEHLYRYFCELRDKKAAPARTLRLKG